MLFKKVSISGMSTAGDALATLTVIKALSIYNQSYNHVRVAVEEIFTACSNGRQVENFASAPPRPEACSFLVS